MKTAWFWETGPDSRYRYISNQFETITGIPVSKALGLSIEEFWLACNRNHRSVAILQQLMAACRPVEGIELRCQHSDGTSHVFRTLGEPIFDDAEIWRGYRGIAIDIAAQKRTEAALREAKRVAERADAMKTRFLMAASHDLQQPLQTISAIRTLLARTIDDPSARQHIDALDTTVQSMRTMLNVLLELNRPRAGTLVPQIRSFPVCDLLSRMQSDFAYLAAEKGLAFHVVPSRAVLRSDPNLLQEIIRNLVANAIKYTDRGKVLLGCRRRGAMARIEVWDSGIGIAEVQRQHIFEEFYQLTDKAHDSHQGLGLGLAIARHLARLLGLALDFRSLPDKGSMFAVTVPLAASSSRITQESEASSASDATNRTASILYIEDNLTILDAMRYLLTIEGFTVIAANSNEQVMDLLHERGFRPDVIVSDYRLPAGVIGPDIIDRIRQEFDAPIPAIVMTADGSGQTVRLAERLGCEVLHKPVDGEQLVYIINRLLDESLCT